MPNTHRPFADLPAERQKYRDSGARRQPVPLESRLWDQVDRSGDCWLWTGPLNWKGYGRIWAFGRTQGVHRVAYRLTYPGRDISGLQVDHTCHNADESCPADRTCAHRRCVNPDHLEVVDNRTNTGRSQNFMAARVLGTAEPATQCATGHRYTDDNIYWSQGTRRCLTCMRAYQREYQQRPDVKAKRAARQRQRNRTPEEMAKRAAYRRSPEGRAKNLAAVRRYTARKAAAKQVGAAVVATGGSD